MGFHTENFVTIFGVKNNIQVLRNKVLELAIQGKLVEQDPNDEPASELVKRIEVETDKLVRKGEITKQKHLVEIKEDEVPFEIPKSWKWVKFSKIVNFTIGKTPQRNEGKYWTNGSYNWIAIADMNSNGYIFDTKEKITELALNDSFRGNISKKETLIMSFKLTVGKVSILKIDSCHNEAIISIYPILDSNNITRDYLFKTLPLLTSYGNTKSAIKGNTLNSDSISNLPIPIPPIAEQHRIVSRIKTLMSEIDKLEEALQKKEHLMVMLPKAVVDSIGKCHTCEELKEKLKFVIENFDILFQTPESMQELRNVILQLAIEGKLLPQDSNDEPASELVKRIKEEKDKLVKQGKIKKEKTLPKIEEDEIPFEIPENWKWVRLGDLAEINPRNRLDDELQVSFIPMKLLDNGYGSSHTSEVKKWKEIKSGFTHFAENDIAIAKITPCFENRKSAILSNLKSGFGAGTTELHIIRILCNSISQKYLLSIFKTQWFINTGINEFTGTAGQQRIGTDFIKRLTIPLPPRSEQERIIRQVESIMRVIDQFENKLREKTDLVEKIATA